MINWNTFVALGVFVAGIALLLLKVGFLIWVFIRTRQGAAIAYALYVLLSNTLGNLPYQILERVSSANPVEGEAIASAMFAIRISGVFIETALFIWLIWSVLKSPRSGNVS